MIMAGRRQDFKSLDLWASISRENKSGGDIGPRSNIYSQSRGGGRIPILLLLVVPRSSTLLTEDADGISLEIT